MLVRPAHRRGVLMGLAIVFLSLAVSALLLWRMGREPVGLSSFTAVVIAAALAVLGFLYAYWTYGCWSLRYRLDRNSLSIHWAGNILHIPLSTVQALIPGNTAPPPRPTSGIGWPGYHMGRGSVPGSNELKEIHLFSTHRSPEELLYVVTPLRVYGLTVLDAPGFAQELRIRRRLGPTERIQEGVQRWTLWESPVWRDRLVLGSVLLAWAANILLFAYQAWLMPALPEVAVLHVSPLGVADLTGPKEQLLLMPTIGLLGLAANTAFGFVLYQWERLATYLLVVAALLVQALLWSGTLQLLG